MSKKTKDFAAFLDAQLDSDPGLKSEVERERLNAVIADLIYRERKRAGLTQQQMADKVGTHQSVIARLEDADYGGHSLSMLWKIADAVNCRLRLEFESLEEADDETSCETVASFNPHWEKSPKWQPKITMLTGLTPWSA